MPWENAAFRNSLYYLFQEHRVYKHSDLGLELPYYRVRVRGCGGRVDTHWKWHQSYKIQPQGHPSSCIHLPDLIAEHLIRRDTVLVFHLLCCFSSTPWHTVLELLSWCWYPSIGHTVWIREVFWQQPELDQGCCLVPGNMLVIQTVTSDVNDRREGNFYFQTCCRNARQSVNESLISYR